MKSEKDLPIIILDHPWSKEHKDLVEDFFSAQILKSNPLSYKGRFNPKMNRLEQSLSMGSSQNEKISDYDASGPLSWWIKREVYRFLDPLSPANLPWGTITGVRPLKVVRRALENGKEAQLEDFYCMDPQKIKLAKKVLSIQDKALGRSSDKDFNLYVHIPFCPSRCTYCSFPSLARPTIKQMEDYAQALIQELAAYGPYLKDKVLKSIYLGGGTPTQLTGPLLDKLLKSIRLYYGPTSEWTVEAGRPDTITAEKLSILRSHGVTRISVNPQSFSDKTLEAIGRSHTVKDVYEACNLVKKMDFDLNMDLIAGLEEEGTGEILSSIRKACELGADNISIHALAIKKGSAISSQNSKALDPDLSEKIASLMEESSYLPYYLYRQRQMIPTMENIGYALENKASHYNIISMEETESVLACGMGAVSKFHIRGKVQQIANFRSLHDYMTRQEERTEKKRTLFSEI